MLPIWENVSIERKVNFAPGKIPLRGRGKGEEQPKRIYSVPAQDTAKHPAQFC